MARENSPQARQGRQLERRAARRPSYDRILIVSEGRKTEPGYFAEIRQAYRLHTASVVVRPSEYGTAPIQVVEYAEALFLHGDAHKGIEPRAFEQVYAVFDRDDHASYFDALSKAEAIDGKLKNDNKARVRFRAVASVPCFELWLLLHYEDVQAPMDRQEVLRRLKSHIPGYEKGMPCVFSITRTQLSGAMQRAQTLAKSHGARSEEGPFTAVGELVERLIQLRTN